MSQTLLPGKTLDSIAPAYLRPASTRLGEQEMQLLDGLAAEFKTSRCHLIRRLLVERLDQLNREGV